MLHQYFEAESHVSTYDKFRPVPPKEMIENIIRYTKQKISGPLELAVDVGCGSGQSTEVFAPYFRKVVGLDSSLSIIKEAQAKCQYSNIHYSQSPAESLPIENSSAVLVSVCQALHWFNINEFYEEVNRILCENGVFAVYGYNLPVPIVDGAHQDLQKIVQRYYKDVLGDFVLPQSRKAYLESYTTEEFNNISFVDGGKMERLKNFVSEIEGTLTDVTGYISSWSTYQNYRKQVGEQKANSILERFEIDFKKLMGKDINPMEKFKIRFNYFLLVGRKI